MSAQPQGVYLKVDSTEKGQRFCLYHPAQLSAEGGAPKGLALYIHPFAEEMNKARRMAALQSRALARAGYAVLQIDLLGCGDSAGDFGDATWQSWVDDVVQGCQWLRDQNHTKCASSQTPLWLWGLRTGCLLAVEAARQIDTPCNYLFWQAPSAGQPLLQQFLRLKVAGNLLGGQTKGVMQALRDQLTGGAHVEIAGYHLAPEMASGLEQAKLSPPPLKHPTQRVEWFELSTRADASLSPFATQTIARWQQAGFAVASHIVTGPAFWQTTEIEDAPELISATIDGMNCVTISH